MQRLVGGFLHAMQLVLCWLRMVRGQSPLRRRVHMRVQVPYDGTCHKVDAWEACKRWSVYLLR